MPGSVVVLSSPGTVLSAHGIASESIKCSHTLDCYDSSGLLSIYHYADGLRDAALTNFTFSYAVCYLGRCQRTHRPRILPSDETIRSTTRSAYGTLQYVARIISVAITHLHLSLLAFVADDYPAYLHLPPTRSSVAFSLEDSVRFGLAQPETQLEWAYTGAVGDSNIRLGPNHRFFNTGFSYQLHCARYLVGAFQQEPPITRGDRAHVSRCLNVIRQFVLCSADTALEPANAMSRNLTAVRYGGDRTCRSWPALYEAMEENWQEWRAFQAGQQNLDM